LDLFFSFLLKQVRIEQSVVKTQTLGQLRLTKAMKTTASAERVTTTSALKAKIEPRLNSCAVCKGEHTITEYKRRQMSDGVCALSEDCVIISSIKVIWPIGAPEENPVVKRVVL
ncbi:hypothetical protein T4C_12464, partial [Trichinella pseudospiralis]